MKALYTFFLVLFSSVPLTAYCGDSIQNKAEFDAIVGYRVLLPVHKIFGDYAKDYNAWNISPGPGNEPFIGVVYFKYPFLLTGEAGVGFFHAWDHDSTVNNQRVRTFYREKFYSLRTEPIYYIPAGAVGFGIGGSLGINYDVTTVKYNDNMDFRTIAGITYGIKAMMSFRVTKYLPVGLMYEYVIYPGHQFSEASIFIPVYGFKI